MHPAIYLNPRQYRQGIHCWSKRSGLCFRANCLFDIKTIPRASGDYCLIAITEISTRALLTKPAA
jgi:hypothetical protein